MSCEVYKPTLGILKEVKQDLMHFSNFFAFALLVVGATAAAIPSTPSSALVKRAGLPGETVCAIAV